MREGLERLWTITAHFGGYIHPIMESTLVTVWLVTAATLIASVLVAGAALAIHFWDDLNVALEEEMKTDESD